jgi:hypothetical protein
LELDALAWIAVVASDFDAADIGPGDDVGRLSLDKLAFDILDDSVLVAKSTISSVPIFVSAVMV